MRTESVDVTEVQVGDVIRDPFDADNWRRVRELGYDLLPKNDGSGEYWELFAFIGPLVDPPADVVESGDQPGFDRFIFREDERVIRRVGSRIPRGLPC
ncbi:hypothetical protein IU459_22260 [Nocardia amamiensis]|uniref:Uncharacterized protein n=1 Tax=Nocardia amamiensis TaxID=404578 RepID=A0ABS0CUI1_9NOCA|nr:hypothetical protein [Nocardia amamiensis]MBF6300247.1 hypothetical protein [Nocardia amamiensis]